MNDANNAGSLLPCPFCGTAMPRHFFRHDEHGRPSYGFQCIGSGCGICGPEAGDIEESARRWNNRYWGFAQDEDDTLVQQVARSIAEHGVGRPWDDFKPVDAYDLGQSDLIEYARAAIAAVPIHALSTPNAPVEQREAIVRIIQEAMVDTWNDICFDTDCHPLDIKHGRGRVLSFTPDHWSRFTGERAADAILAVRLDETAIRKDEREKATHEADQFVGALWSDLFNKDMVKAAGAYFFDKWRAQIRAIAIRNGGKQP